MVKMMTSNDDLSRRLQETIRRDQRREQVARRDEAMKAHPLYELVDMMDSRLMACESLLERIAVALEEQNRRRPADPVPMERYP